MIAHTQTWVTSVTDMSKHHYRVQAEVKEASVVSASKAWEVSRSAVSAVGNQRQHNYYTRDMCAVPHSDPFTRILQRCTDRYP